MLDCREMLLLDTCLPRRHEEDVSREWPERMKSVHSTQHLVPQFNCALDTKHDHMSSAQVHAVGQTVRGDEVVNALVKLLQPFPLKR
jgi:hypothetical protein